MLAYMEKNYCGYQMDLVFNPQNTAISRPLKLKGAIFDPEQQKMILIGPVPNVSTNHIELLSDKWTKQYCDLHSTDTYWTAERILLAQDKFRVLLAVKRWTGSWLFGRTMLLRNQWDLCFVCKTWSSPAGLWTCAAGKGHRTEPAKSNDGGCRCRCRRRNRIIYCCWVWQVGRPEQYYCLYQIEAL